MTYDLNFTLAGMEKGLLRNDPKKIVPLLTRINYLLISS